MEKKTNKQMMILSVIGIFTVVICHLAGRIYDFISIFPFITIFVFITGYFYKEENEKHIGKYIWHKFKTLMIPLLTINLIYGIIINLLKNNGVIQYGANITLYTVFIQPFLNNSQFVFDFPAYYVPAIFLTSICYILIHKIIGKTKIINDNVLLLIFIILQIMAIYYQNIVKENEYIIIGLRILYFLPFMQFGHIYKTKLEKYDKRIKTIPYLIILITINLVLYFLFGKFNIDMHDFSISQKDWPIIPFIISIVAILFYNRIAGILSKFIGKNKIVNYISNHTFTIMTNHIFVSFLISWMIYSVKDVLSINYFDIQKFKTGWIYLYEIPHFEIVSEIIYVILAISVTLLGQFLYDKIKEKVLTKIYSKENL